MQLARWPAWGSKCTGGSKRTNTYIYMYVGHISPSLAHTHLFRVSSAIDSTSGHSSHCLNRCSSRQLIMSATATTTTSDPHVVLENDVNHIPRGDVEAPMQFFEYPEDGSEPYNLMEGHLKGGTQPNYPLSTHTISITDIRGKESEYSLAKHGFQGVSNVPSAADPSFCDEENIKSVWLVSRSREIRRRTIPRGQTHIYLQPHCPPFSAWR